MIIEHISVDGRFLSKDIRKALDILNEKDLYALSPGRYDIDENMFLMISEYQTIDFSGKEAEQHRKYIDVQYVISGEEKFGLGFESEMNKVSREYDEEKDCVHYCDVADEIFIPFKQGMVAVFYPEDIHRPGLNPECGLRKVKKAVVKVLIDQVYSITA